MLVRSTTHLYRATWAASVARWPLPDHPPHPGSSWDDGVWQPESAQSLQPAYGGIRQNDCCIPAKAVLLYSLLLVVMSQTHSWAIPPKDEV